MTEVLQQEATETSPIPKPQDMTPILVRYEADYADEFNIHGLWGGPTYLWQEYLEAAEKAKYPVELCFGTNEAIEYFSYNDWLADLKIVTITLVEFQILRDRFAQLGICPNTAKSFSFGHVLSPGD